MSKPAVFTAFAGIRNTLPAERLHVMPTKDDGTTDLVEAVNVDLDNSGQPARRAGTTLELSGAPHSIWARGDVCLFAAGSTLKRLATDYSSAVLAAGLTPGLPLCYEQVNDRIYWANSSESGVVVRGVNRSWGIAIPGAPSMAPIAGFLPAGQYQCVVTFVRSDAQESGAALPSLFTLTAAGGLRVGWIAPADADITHARVYLSEPNGQTMYLAADVPVGSHSADITTGGSAVPLNTQWQDKPPAAQALAYTNGLLYLAVGEFIFPTTALGFEYVDLRDYIALDGSRVRLLAGVTDGLFAATANAAYFLTGKTLQDLTLRIVSTQGGVEGSVVYVDGQVATGDEALAGMRCVMFATGEGVFLGLPDGSVRNLTSKRYQFDPAVAGCAVFHETDALNSYLLFLQS